MEKVRYKDMGYSLLLKAFGNSPKLRIIDIFLTNPYFDFSREELVRELGMSKQTIYKSFKDLEALNIIKFSRAVGRARMYKINIEHPLVKKLDELINEISLQIGREQLGKTKKVVAIAR